MDLHVRHYFKEVCSKFTSGSTYENRFDAFATCNIIAHVTCFLTNLFNVSLTLFSRLLLLPEDDFSCENDHLILLQGSLCKVR